MRGSTALSLPLQLIYIFSIFLFVLDPGFKCQELNEQNFILEPDPALASDPAPANRQVSIS